MHKLLIAIAAAAALVTPAAATPPLPGPPPPAPPPRLLIVIGVDQLAADLFDEYRPMLFGGFARLARGTVFRNGYQSHAATETCPGYSTILTGLRPARTGIVANNWIDQSAARADKTVYCAEDESVAGSTSRNYTVSPVHLRGATLGDRLKASRPGSRSVVVAGKDRAAAMLGGHRPDQRWYWSGRGFTTDLAGITPPRSIALTNAAVAAAIAAPREPLDAPVLCSGKSKVYPLGPGADARTVGDGRFAREAGNVRAFQSSPEYDAAVLALAAALIEELKLGRGSATDLLAIGLSATDYVGHTYGTGGQEMCLQLLSLDRDLGDFFQLLDRSGIDYAVALTADHGALDIPPRVRERVPAAAYVDAALEAEAVGKRIGAKLGLEGPVLMGDYAGDIYVDRGLSAANRAQVIDEAVALYRAHTQVAAVFTNEELARAPAPIQSPDRWSLLERARASFDPARSGDLVVILKSHIAPYPPDGRLASTHGSPWDYDRRVPIVLWRPAMAAADRSEPVETADLMPTLAAMLGLAVNSSSIDGKCLTGIQGIACPPR